MLNIIKALKVMVWFFLFLGASFLLMSPSWAHDFLEGWESAAIGTSIPTAFISADGGTWLVDDTISAFPECGPSLNRAEIFTVSGNKALRLTSNDSNNECSDNVTALLREIPPLGLNLGFSIPISNNTYISFEEAGELYNPQSASHRCLVVPCGDTISLMLSDNNGNVLAYIFQHALDAVPNEIHSTYREIFLDPIAGKHLRDLFTDFSIIPSFNPNDAQIKSIEFKIQQHGWGIIDKIIVTTDETIKPLSAGFSANPTSGNAPLNVDFTDESTGTITSWNWNFGDGASSAIQNPSHTYAEEGKYRVSLTVSGPYGSDTETKTDYIKVSYPSKAMPWIPLLLDDER